MTKRSAYFKAIEADNTISLEFEAKKLWLKDLENPFRWTIMPIMQFVFSILLHLIWFLKRLPLPQFSAHNRLQKIICWFCRNFVSCEANLLILRHYSCESNIINFLIDNQLKNAKKLKINPIKLFPKHIDAMLEDSFVKHDQELFRCFEEMGTWQIKSTASTELQWVNWQSVDNSKFIIEKKSTQIFDFETSHALFMCLFCLLLTREEYQDAINGFNLDQSMALRVGKILNEPSIGDWAYNKFPHFIVGPSNLNQRFLMHGFFCEYLYAYLESIRCSIVNQD